MWCLSFKGDTPEALANGASWPLQITEMVIFFETTTFLNVFVLINIVTNKPKINRIYES